MSAQASLANYAVAPNPDDSLDLADLLDVRFLYRDKERTPYVVTVDPATCERCEVLPVGCVEHRGCRGSFFPGGLP